MALNNYSVRLLLLLLLFYTPGSRDPRGYYYYYYYLSLGSLWSRGMTKIRSILKYYRISWNGLPPRQQSSREAGLHWSVESTRSTAGKESCRLKFHRKLRQSCHVTLYWTCGCDWQDHPCMTIDHVTFFFLLFYVVMWLCWDVLCWFVLLNWFLFL